MYTPDRWVILTLRHPEYAPFSRVFAGWYGGYTGSDSWKMNSGIKGWMQHKDYFEFDGASGSVYRCYKNAHGMSAYMGSVLANFQDQLAAQGGQLVIEDEHNLEGIILC
jgi:hypothetical protein